MRKRQTESEREVEMLRRIIAAGQEMNADEVSKKFSDQLRKDVAALQGSSPNRDRIARLLGLKKDDKKGDDDG